jgi:hypothetical protein
MFFLQIWRHYNAGTLMELMDPNLREQCSEEDAVQVFHVGLLCTQASPNLRPPMWKMVEMLSCRDHNVVLPRPTQPPFINVKGSNAKSDSPGSPFSLSQLSVRCRPGKRCGWRYVLLFFFFWSNLEGPRPLQ